MTSSLVVVGAAPLSILDIKRLDIISITVNKNKKAMSYMNDHLAWQQRLAQEFKANST